MIAPTFARSYSRRFSRPAYTFPARACPRRFSLLAQCSHPAHARPGDRPRACSRPARACPARTWGDVPGQISRQNSSTSEAIPIDHHQVNGSRSAYHSAGSIPYVDFDSLYARVYVRRPSQSATARPAATLHSRVAVSNIRHSHPQPRSMAMWLMVP